MHEAVTAYLALGSNLGDRRAQLESAVRSLQRLPSVDVVRVSSFIETEPVGPADQNKFLNAAVQMRTTFSARQLLDECLAIEAAHGRDRQVQQRWGPRTLDIDLLLFGDQVIDQPGLRVPHPHMHERGFVLVPLVEIAPQAMHPLLGQTMRDLLARLAVNR